MVRGTTEHKDLKYPRNYHRVELVPSHVSFSLVLKCGPLGSDSEAHSTFLFLFLGPLISEQRVIVWSGRLQGF